MGSLFVLFFKYLQMNKYFVNASLFLTICQEMSSVNFLPIKLIIFSWPTNGGFYKCVMGMGKGTRLRYEIDT